MSQSSREIVFIILHLLQGNSGNFTKLVADKLIYLGPVDLTQYFIKSYDITDDDQVLGRLTNGHPGVMVNIVFSRRLLNQILATFLPTIAIVLTCFSTNFWRVINYQQKMTTNTHNADLVQC